MDAVCNVLLYVVTKLTFHQQYTIVLEYKNHRSIT